MVTIHLPAMDTVQATATALGYITEGLDAVVRSSEPSRRHEGFTAVQVAGNPRDLSRARERAEKLGGEVE